MSASDINIRDERVTTSYLSNATLDKIHQVEV